MSKAATKQNSSIAFERFLAAYVLTHFVNEQMKDQKYVFGVWYSENGHLGNFMNKYLINAYMFGNQSLGKSDKWVF